MSDVNTAAFFTREGGLFTNCIQTHRPTRFEFSGQGRSMVVFHADGRIELGEGAKPSEAAKVMFQLLEPMLRRAFGTEATKAAFLAGWTANADHAATTEHKSYLNGCALVDWDEYLRTSTVVPQD